MQFESAWGYFFIPHQPICLIFSNRLLDTIVFVFRKRLVTLFTLFCIGCGSIELSPPATNTPSFVTATLPPTSAPQATPTSPPSLPTPISTNLPVQGTTTSQINVRVETNTASESLGVIPAFTSIQILGKESTGNWMKVLYENSVGWVRAEFVQVDISIEVPVVSLEATQTLARNGVVTSGINVRSGAGTQFESIGVLTQNDVVLVIGKSESGAWLQIQFIGKTGWVAAEFLQIEEIEEVPVVDAIEDTPAAPLIPETPIVANKIAFQDNDMMQAPLAQVLLTKNKILQITGDVSFPQGDLEDWVEFSSTTSNLLIELTCDGNSLNMEVWQANQVTESFSSPCNNKTLLSPSPNESYTLRIFQASTMENQYTSYKLSIKVVD